MAFTPSSPPGDDDHPDRSTEVAKPEPVPRAEPADHADEIPEPSNESPPTPQSQAPEREAQIQSHLPWPRPAPLRVARWELPDLYNQIKARLLELEAAWEAGDLELALEDGERRRTVGSDACEAYYKLSRAGDPRQQDFRRASIHALLDEAKQMLREPQCWFQTRIDDGNALAAATPDAPAGPDTPRTPDAPLTPDAPAGPESTASSPSGPAPPAFSPSRTCLHVEGPEQERTLRVDQGIAAAFWGIGYQIDEPVSEAWFASRLLRQTQRRLGSDLFGLYSISQWLGRRGDGDRPQIVPDPVGRQFEQLMLDMLNEEEEIGHHATLFEDFLQKTDLRVHLPGLGRPRGARVQVTQTIHTGQHNEKLARIRRLPEFVILSPRSLALALGEESGARLLTGPDRDQFWECLGCRPASVEELATALKSIFLGAIQRAREDPRGPVAAIPPPIRLLVRAFVVREGYRTTVELRRREFNEGKWEPDSPKLHVVRRHGRGLSAGEAEDGTGIDDNVQPADGEPH